MSEFHSLGEIAAGNIHTAGFVSDWYQERQSPGEPVVFCCFRPADCLRWTLWTQCWTQTGYDCDHDRGYDYDQGLHCQ